MSQLMQQYEHVDIYTDTFDDKVHEELKRSRRVIDHSLTGLFMHSEAAMRFRAGEQSTIIGRNDADLTQIVLENIMNWDELQGPKPSIHSILRISDYIRISINEECHRRFTDRIC